MRFLGFVLLLLLPVSSALKAGKGRRRKSEVPTVACELLSRRQGETIVAGSGAGATVKIVSSTLKRSNGVEMCHVQAEWSRRTVGETTVLLPTTTWSERYLQLGSSLQQEREPPLEIMLMNSSSIFSSFVCAQTKTPIHGDLVNASSLEKALWRLDFAHVAQHLTSQWVQTILVPLFYTKKPTFSYFLGYSDYNAGRQAMVHAQRYPNDFDGVLAGAPAVYMTTLIGVVWPWIHGQSAPFSDDTLTRAVLEECDERDGLQDGILHDPRTCDFDPVVLRCEEDETASCLTASQVQAIQNMYTGPRDGTHGRKKRPLTMATVMRGSEPYWKEEENVEKINVLGQLLFDEMPPAFTKSYFDKVVRPWHGLYGATAVPSMSSQQKMIAYHGWSDPVYSPLYSIAFHERIMNENTQLYMIPACSSRITELDRDTMFTRLIAWVEQGTKPSKTNVGKNMTVYPFNAESTARNNDKFHPNGARRVEWVGHDLLEQPLLDCRATEQGLKCQPQEQQAKEVTTTPKRLRKRD